MTKVNKSRIWTDPIESVLAEIPMDSTMSPVEDTYLYSGDSSKEPFDVDPSRCYPLISRCPARLTTSVARML